MAQSTKVIYRSLPSFIQSTIYLNQYQNTRNQLFNQKITAAEILKSQGNSFYTQNQFQNAIEKYQSALSLFEYLQSDTINEFNQSVGQHVLLFSYQPLNNWEVKKLTDFKNKIYINLSMAFFKENSFQDSIDACNYALETQPENNYKALFRRAKARLSINANDDTFIYLSLVDLQNAHKIKYEPEIEKEYQRVQSLYMQIKNNKQLQGEKVQERKFFNLEDIKSDDEETDEENVPQLNSKLNQKQFLRNVHLDKTIGSFSYELSYEENPLAKIPPEVNELGKFIEIRGKQMVNIFRQKGKIKEAEELEEKLRKALEAKFQLEKISRLDFNKPKSHLIAIAQKYGVDLFDQQIQEEFVRIQNQNLEDIRSWLKQNNWEFGQDQKNSNYMTNNNSSSSIIIGPGRLSKNIRRKVDRRRHRDQIQVTISQKNNDEEKFELKIPRKLLKWILISVIIMTLYYMGIFVCSYLEAQNQNL